MPVIGGFSAGKSSLINAFIGRKVLAENVSPETALATELHYAEKEKIEAIGENNVITTYALADFPKIKDNVQNYQYLRIYLNNEYLKQLYPVILVDMPGFDAADISYAAHKTAIDAYLNRGAYYIVLSSVQKGTIEKSLESQLDKLERWGKDYVFALTRADLRSDEEIEEIKAHVQELLEDRDYEEEIEVFSIYHDKYDLSKLIKQIQPEQRFKNYYYDTLFANNKALQNSLTTKINVYTADQKEAEEALSYLTRQIQRLDEQKANKMQILRGRFANKNADKVISQIVSAISAEKSRLIDLALDNTNAFSQRFSEIVETNLKNGIEDHLKKTTEAIIQDYGDELKDTLEQFQSNNSNDTAIILAGDFIKHIQESAHRLINQVDLQQFSVHKESGFFDTLLSSLPDILAKLIPVAFKPFTTIISAFFSLFGSSRTDYPSEAQIREENYRNVENHLTYSVIPKIEGEIKQQLDSLMKQHIEQLIRQIGEEFTHQLSGKKSEIEQALQEKQQNTDNLQQQIELLNKAKVELEKLAKKLTNM